MGNSQSGENDLRDKFLQKSSIENEILQKQYVKAHLEHLQKTKQNSNTHTKNQLFSNPELQNTFLQSRTMQKQLLTHLKDKHSKEKSKINKDNYITVNTYLSNLNVGYDEYEQKEPYLYINQGSDYSTADPDFLEKEKEIEDEFKKTEEKRRGIFREEQQKRRQQ